MNMHNDHRPTCFNRLTLAALAAWIAVGTLACSRNIKTFDNDVPAQFLSVVGAAPVADGRPRFRQIFCELLGQTPGGTGENVDCDGYIWRLADEGSAGGNDRPGPFHDPSFKILIVPGAFNDCFPELGPPFQESIERLRHLGYHIDIIPVEGRSGTGRDAHLIAKRVSTETDNGDRRLMLIGYSKGVTDILHFLVDFPELARRVAAVVSVSGAVNGSPLAEKFEGLYGRWFADALPTRCPPGDKRVIVSLERDVQMLWLASHPLPRQVAYFSLGTFTTRAGVARVLLPGYDLLAGLEPRNDGQLLFTDQVIPGSTLLGFANTDHWDIALPVRRVHPFWGRPAGSGESPPFPRDILFEAMILTVIEKLMHPKP
jgi:hypothetical protein